MPITSQSQGLAEEKLLAVQLRPLVGAYELVFVFGGTIYAHQTAAKYWLTIHSVRITAQSRLGQRAIGTAILGMPVTIDQKTQPRHLGLEIVLPLHPSQLMALEDHRNSGDLDFELNLIGYSGIGAFSHDYKQEQVIRAHVDESAWVAQLKSANALNILLLEIPMPMTGASPKQKAVFEHIRHAQRLFCDGHYTECVGECRKAFEELSQGKPQIWAMLADKNAREGMGKDERTRAILSLMHHYTQIAAHSASRGGISDYDRADAKFLLSLVATYIEHESNAP
jgi:hypothetical protein